MHAEPETRGIRAPQAAQALIFGAPPAPPPAILAPNSRPVQVRIVVRFLAT